MLFLTFTASSPLFFPLVLLYLLHFLVFLLLFAYAKLDSSFVYQVIVEVCKSLIISIFTIISLFVCIMCFCGIYRNKNKTAHWIVTLNKWHTDIKNLPYTTGPQSFYFTKVAHLKNLHICRLDWISLSPVCKTQRK